MTMRGHNENAIRLSVLAGDAQIALDRVAAGEGEAVEGWLAYGAALNEGRALFPGDREFGQWIEANVLGQLAQGPVEPKEQQAAMWAAGNHDQFAEARAAGKARTVRGIHEKWKQIEAEREKDRAAAERKAEDERKRGEAVAARREAEALAKVEAEARQAAAQAETEPERQEAEAKAAKASEAKVEAEKAAEAVEAMIDRAPESEPEIEPVASVDPETTKARRALAKLTTDALIDEVIGLRADHADQKAQIAKLKAEREDDQNIIRSLTEGGADRTIANLRRAITTAEGRMKEFQTTAVRSDKRVKALEAEIKRLNAKLETQEIPL